MFPRTEGFTGLGKQYIAPASRNCLYQSVAVSNWAMDSSNKPHPLLKSATIYVTDVPADLKWAQLVSAFASCGPVISGGKANALENWRKWIVTFTDVFSGVYLLFNMS
jgi:hypothetical protein